MTYLKFMQVIISIDCMQDTTNIRKGSQQIDGGALALLVPHIDKQNFPLSHCSDHKSSFTLVESK